MSRLSGSDFPKWGDVWGTAGKGCGAPRAPRWGGSRESSRGHRGRATAPGVWWGCPVRGKKTLPKSIINGSVPALHAEVPLICSNFAKKNHNK